VLRYVPKYKPDDYDSLRDEFPTFLTTDLTDLIDDFKGNLLPASPEKRAKNICLMKAFFNSVNNAGKAGSSAMAITRPNLTLRAANTMVSKPTGL
jgi:hypothetical protein